MLIELSDEWRIRVVPMNWILERFVEVKPKNKAAHYEWTFQGYYASQEQCIRAIPEHLAQSPEIKTLKCLEAAVERFTGAMFKNRDRR